MKPYRSDDLLDALAVGLDRDDVPCVASISDPETGENATVRMVTVTFADGERYAVIVKRIGGEVE